MFAVRHSLVLIPSSAQEAFTFFFPPQNSTTLTLSWEMFIPCTRFRQLLEREIYEEVRHMNSFAESIKNSLAKHTPKV